MIPDAASGFGLGWTTRVGGLSHRGDQGIVGPVERLQTARHLENLEPGVTLSRGQLSYAAPPQMMVL